MRFIMKNIDLKMGLPATPYLHGNLKHNGFKLSFYHEFMKTLGEQHVKITSTNKIFSDTQDLKEFVINTVYNNGNDCFDNLVKSTGIEDAETYNYDFYRAKQHDVVKDAYEFLKLKMEL